MGCVLYVQKIGFEMPIKQKIDELTGWVNWNYMGLAAGILSVVVTLNNIWRYTEQIRKEKEGK